MKKILVVEDDITTSKFICNVLIETGLYETYQAFNGQEALDYLSTSRNYLSRSGHDIDAIILDLKMPVMDGLEFLAHQRKYDKENRTMMPVIVLTAYEDYDIWKQVTDFQKGLVHDYLKKPIFENEREIIDSLDKLFKSTNREVTMYELWCRGLDKIAEHNAALELENER